jgi:hypothetical protein
MLTGAKGTGNAMDKIPEHPREHPPMPTPQNQNIEAEAASTSLTLELIQVGE